MMKRRFEEEWKSALDNVEASPSDGVWKGIELHLEKASGMRARKQLAAYRWVAAASVSVAVGISAFYFLSKEKSAAPAALQEQVTEGTDDNNLQADSQVSSEEPVGEKPSTISLGYKKNVPEVKSSSKLSTNMAGITGNQSAPEMTAPSRNYSPHGGTHRQMPALYTFKNPELRLVKPTPVADPGMVLLAQLADLEKAYQQEDKKHLKDERLWTSVGFGAGTFNPNAGRPAAVTNFNSTGNASAGASYSIGAIVGGRLSSRFVLQGGVSYLSQNASHTSSLFSQEATAAVASLDDFFDTQQNLVVTSPYTVNSNLQFVSFPVQAGYVILDRGFAIQFNGGFSTDFFVQNSLVPDNDNLAGVTQRAGDGSPYRSVNFSGIMGTELSYKFGGRYRIAFNPGIRYALNSIYKPGISSELTPVTYDVALRFRYIFVDTTNRKK